MHRDEWRCKLFRAGSRKEVKNIIPKQYQKPVLTEYGRVGQLTLGAGGTQPDFSLTGGLHLVNSTCFAEAPATACLLPTS